MANTVVNLNEVNSDYIFFEYYQQSNGETRNPKKSMMKFLIKASEIALSKKQKFYFTEHYVKGKSVTEIAIESGRHKSTVSREITKARDKLRAFAPLYFN